MLRYRVHSLIRSRGPVSRAEVSRLLGVSKPSVTSIVRQLLDLGLVMESGTEPSMGGRRGIGLELVAHARTVVGVDIGATNTRAAISDVKGRIVKVIVARTAGRSDAELARQIVTLCDRLVDRTGMPHPTAVAIGTPGVVDPESGSVRYAPNLPALEQPGLLRRVEEGLGARVTFHNDVNSAAIGELWVGAGRGLETFVLVGIGTGLGYGLVLNGELFKGSLGRAGESSLTRINPIRARTIEDVVSGVGIARAHREAGGSGRPEDAFAQAGEGAEPGASVVKTFLRYLAWVIAAHVATLDPQRIILGGGIGLQLGPYLPRLCELVAASAPFQVEIAISDLGDWAGLHGAVWSALWTDDQRLLRQLEPRSHSAVESIAYLAFRESMTVLADSACRAAVKALESSAADGTTSRPLPVDTQGRLAAAFADRTQP